MVHRMLKRGALLAPVLIAALWITMDAEAALSGAIGLALTLLNLWVAGRVIGGVAENAPHLLMPAALAAFMFGLIALSVTAVVLKRIEGVDFPVTGITLVVSHLVLVTWEAASSLL